MEPWSRFSGRRTLTLRSPRTRAVSFRPAHAKARQRAPATFKMKLLGANPAARMEGVDELPGKSNYFIGNDPKKWRTNVPNYGKVRYDEVYRGVDLIFYGHEQQLEYDFVVAPGGDPAAIQLSFEGTKGLHVDQEGNLVLNLGTGLSCDL